MLTMTHPMAPVWRVAIGLGLLVGAASGSLAARAKPDALVPVLQRGGLVLVMRHASSPREMPAPEQARPDNTSLERQLDEAGRQGATAMGDALRARELAQAMRLGIEDLATIPVVFAGYNWATRKDRVVIEPNVLGFTQAMLIKPAK